MSKQIFGLLIVFIFCSTIKSEGAIFYVTNTNDAGAGSLRQAIIDANVYYPKDTIIFNLSGPAPYVFRPLTPYDKIKYPLVIDGFTQPLNNDTTYSIVFDGIITRNTGDPIFQLTSPYCEIKGLKVINDYKLAEIIFDIGSTFRRFHNLKITNNQFYDCGDLFGYFFTPDTILIDSVFVDNNYLYKSAGQYFSASGTGSKVQYISNLNFTNNIVDSCDGFRFNVGGTGNFIGLLRNFNISGNVFKNNYRPVMFQIGGTGNLQGRIVNINISNNTFSDFEDYAIGFESGLVSGAGSFDSLYINNNIISHGTSTIRTPFGILFSLNGKTTVSGFSCTNNKIDSTNTGIFLDLFNGRMDLKNLLIDSNTIQNHVYGIRFRNNSSGPLSELQSARINNNIVRKCDYGICFLNTGSNNAIVKTRNISLTGNNIHECDSIGFLIWNTDRCSANKNFIDSIHVQNNRIYDNGGYGICLINNFTSSICNLRSAVLNNIVFSENSIYNNLRKGIMIKDYADSVNFSGYEFPIPQLDYFSSGPLVNGQINGEINTSYRIEFFNNAVAHSSGYGEGETYLGYDSVRTDNTGFASFSFSAPGINVGSCISATSTDYTHFNTSEFGNCLTYLFQGITENTNSYTLNIYPNPSSGLVNFSSDKIIEQIIIYDLSGRIINEFFPRKNELNASFNRGIYFAKFFSGDFIERRKIIIQ